MKRLLAGITALVLLSCTSISADSVSQGGMHPGALSLREAEEYALRHNPQLQASLLMRDQGKYRKRDALSKLLPNLSVTARGHRTALGGSLGYDTLYQSTIGVKQPLWIADAYHGYRASRIEAELLKFDDLSIVTSLLFQTRSAFYLVVLEQQRVETERANIRLLQEAYENELRRVQARTSTEFELQQSKVALTEAWSSYYRAVKQLRVAVNALSVLLGVDPLVDLKLDADEFAISEIPLIWDHLESLDQSQAMTLNGLPEIFSEKEIWNWESQALKNRPELSRQQKVLEASQRAVKQRRGEYWPQISGYVDYHNDSTGSFSFLSRESYWDFGVMLNWTLFDSWGRESRVQEAKLGRSAAERELDQVRRDTKTEVRNRFHELEEALLSYHAAEQGSELAAEAVRLAGNRREAGVITPLEYRDAANGLRQSKQRFYEAQYQLLMAYYALLQTSGADVSWVRSGDEV